MTADPIQAAIDVLEYSDNRILYLGNMCNYIHQNHDENYTHPLIKDALEQLRAHQSEVAELKSVNRSQRKNLDRLYAEGIRDQQQIKVLKEAVRDLAFAVRHYSADPDEAILTKHAATIKAAGGA